MAAWLTARVNPTIYVPITTVKRRWEGLRGIVGLTLAVNLVSCGQPGLSRRAKRRSQSVRSVSTSRALERSSQTSSSVPRTNIRASAARCIWPPESLTPLVPITASYTAPCSTSAGTARRQGSVSFFFFLCGAAPGCHVSVSSSVYRGGAWVACSTLRSAVAACPHALLRGDPPNLAHILLGEPEVAIRPGCDALRSALGRGDTEPGEAAAGRDAPDLVPTGVGKPEVAIRPGGDAERAIGHGELGDAATGGDAPDLARAIREPEVAIRPGGDVERRALRRDGVLGDGACCGPDGSAAQAQQTDTGNYGGEKCGQVRPPSRTIHGSFSFIGVATHRYQEDVSSSLQPGVWAAGQRPGAEPAARVGTAGSKVSAPRMSTIGPVNKRERTNVGSTWASQSFLQAHQPCNQDRFTRLKICSTICFSSSERK